ncbi:hypothetical protein [Cellulomonas uda]|uniref:Uncharacterized protein n=1 Tax=Cellulomonas uda TaxID=1714 RepID=A0A4Y3K892_CELUD|nr:hypothetical protein [Cellulomonas uda]NII67817.1 hypothetical protein [Cellulomonas uda]GEA79936.1 hypothetical protein CUD01_03800 [Cellulomonas uda]
MARIRNVSGEALAVPELGWRTVAPDEVVEVPDDRVEAFTYQDAWQPESAAAAPTAARRPRMTTARGTAPDDDPTEPACEVDDQAGEA